MTLVGKCHFLFLALCFSFSCILLCSAAIERDPTLYSRDGIIYVTPEAVSLQCPDCANDKSALRICCKGTITDTYTCMYNFTSDKRTLNSNFLCTPCTLLKNRVTIKIIFIKMEKFATRTWDTKVQQLHNNPFYATIQIVQISMQQLSPVVCNTLFAATHLLGPHFSVANLLIALCAQRYVRNLFLKT